MFARQPTTQNYRRHRLIVIDLLGHYDQTWINTISALFQESSLQIRCEVVKTLTNEELEGIKHKHSVVMINAGAQHGTAMELCERIHYRHPLLYIMVTHSAPSHENDYRRAGASDVLTRSLSTDTSIVTALRHGIKKKSMVGKLEMSQQALMHNDRQILAGNLASGIAHEVNNLNTIIRGNVELAQRCDTINQVVQRLSAIDKAVERSAEVTDSLLAFVNESAPDNETINMQEVLRSSIDLIYSTLIAESIQLETHIPDEIIYFDGQRGEVGQVILNIMMNAVRAMDTRNSKHLMVALHSNDEDLQILIRDNGIGIDEDQIDYIFTPFFTNWDDGELNGTGLGLSICKDIITRHHGTISVKSEHGNGAEFIVTMPLTQKEDLKTSSSSRLTIKSLSGIRVLIVDDQAALRQLLADLTRDAGCLSVEADNGRNALDKMGNQDFDIILLDWQMPIMNGQRFLEALLESRPDSLLPVIVVSGWQNSNPQDTHYPRELIEMVPKPFNATTILSMISRMVGKKAPNNLE